MTAEKAFKIYNTFRLVTLVILIGALIWFTSKPVNEDKASTNVEVSEVVDTEQTSK